MNMLRPEQKRTWAEINLNSAEYNYLVIKRQVKTNTKICCVVKANAYGHGAIQLAKLYSELGANYLAVSSVEEALQLRYADIKLPLLILGYVDPECVTLLSEHDITQCVFSYDYGKILSQKATEKGVVIKTHIKMDTGMGRIGFKCTNNELDDIASICSMPGLSHEGIFTHFASADEGYDGREYTLKQFDSFMNSIEYLASNGIVFPIKHCANSATIFDYPDMHLDMVRAGIVLYGLQPSNSLLHPDHLKQVMTLKSVISHIKSSEKGDYISYGREYRADHNIRVATIPIGYADGLWRSNYAHHMEVEIEGKNAPIIGRICMDQCMADISDIPEANVGSVVTIYGESESNCIDRIAESNNTINYEIICALGERVPRVYIKDNKPIYVVNLLSEH